jgi:hypothetical protein
MPTTYMLGAVLVLSLPCFAQTAGSITGVVTDPCTLLRAGLNTRLIVFDAKHGFWYTFDLPQSREALGAQASFLDHHLT